MHFAFEELQVTLGQQRQVRRVLVAVRFCLRKGDFVKG